MSLQNALDLAHTPLSNVPQYGTREMLLLVRLPLRTMFPSAAAPGDASLCRSLCSG